MCGIVGYLSAATPLAHERIVEIMAGSLRHRGPDDAGIWSNPEVGIALGHRRLSILDLSPAGHQPMVSSSGRFVTAFNGEIYNHQSIREELASIGAAPAWHGHSDTETLLAAIERWGMEGALSRCVGMFAISVWDNSERALHLARDRFGEKPLYYGWIGAGFAFGSELKALRSVPGFSNTICRTALAQYLRFLYVPAPRSIYSGVFKLEPGCLLTVSEQAPARAPPLPLRPNETYESVSLTQWWSMSQAVGSAMTRPYSHPQEGLDCLDQALKESVKLQSLADVPLGAFLSGGIDSSTVVALMQEQSSRPIQTFTIGFAEEAYNEAPYARAVASHLGTSHTEVTVTADEARSVIRDLPSMYDEPFADSSQIPTHLVCRVARQSVTVALSGDGGDELFGGYNRYFWGPHFWDRVDWIPYPLRRTLGTAIAATPVPVLDGIGALVSRLDPRPHGLARVGHKAHKLAARLDEIRTREDIYRSLVSQWNDAADVVIGAEAVEPPVFSDQVPGFIKDEQLRMMYLDSVSYLPDDILCKVDRAAMAVSLETRVPLLDHRVAEVAWRMPMNMKIRGRQGKWALRQILFRRVPRELIERPKTGFSVPIAEWLRGPLRSWAEDLLSADRLSADGYFRPEPIRAAWKQHLEGRHDWSEKLWSILMFQAWLPASAPVK